MRRTNINNFFCSSSLWTCSHHMVILRSQNKITIFLWRDSFNHYSRALLRSPPWPDSRSETFSFLRPPLCATWPFASWNPWIPSFWWGSCRRLTWTTPPPAGPSQSSTAHRTWRVRHGSNVNPLSPHDALKHHFTSLKNHIIFQLLGVLGWIFHETGLPIHGNFLIFHPLQVIFIHYQLRIATAIRDL